MDTKHVEMLVAMMESDHRRQNALLARIGRSLDDGFAGQVRLALSEFGVRLYKHIKIENYLLAPALGMPPEGMGSLEDLQAEHAEILAKLALVEGRLEEKAGSGRVADAWRDFSAAFLRHEEREEHYLFPYWEHALSRLPDDESATLFRRVRETHHTAF